MSFNDISVISNRRHISLLTEDILYTINEQIPKGNQKDRDISSLWW